MLTSSNLLYTLIVCAQEVLTGRAQGPRFMTVAMLEATSFSRYNTP